MNHMRIRVVCLPQSQHQRPTACKGFTWTSCAGNDTPAISLFLHVPVRTAQSQATSRDGKLGGRACSTAVMCGRAAGQQKGQKAEGAGSEGRAHTQAYAITAATGGMHFKTVIICSQHNARLNPSLNPSASCRLGNGLSRAHSIPMHCRISVHVNSCARRNTAPCLDCHPKQPPPGVPT